MKRIERLIVYNTRMNMCSGINVLGHGSCVVVDNMLLAMVDYFGKDGERWDDDVLTAYHCYIMYTMFY